MSSTRRRTATNRCIRATCWCVLLGTCGMTLAQTSAPVCKYLDAEGNIHYVNVSPEKGWKKLACDIGGETVRSGSGSAKSTPTPAGFPKVDADTQKGRDDMRRKVLSDELSTEEKLLVESRAAYGDGAPAPLPDEMSNAQKYADRLAKLRQAVSLHEKNVEALRKELAALR